MEKTLRVQNRTHGTAYGGGRENNEGERSSLQNRRNLCQMGSSSLTVTQHSIVGPARQTRETHIPLPAVECISSPYLCTLLPPTVWYMDPHPLHRGTPPLTHPHCHAFASAIFLSRMHCFSPPIYPGASWPPVARPPAAQPPQLCGVAIPDTGEGTGRQKKKLEEISKYLGPYGKTQTLTMFLSLSSHFHGQGTVVSWVTRGPRECAWGSRWTSDLVTTGTGWPQTTESQSWQTKTSCQVGIRSLLAHLW